jgi:hypothetical protein
MATDAPAGVIGLISGDQKNETLELAESFWKVLDASKNMKPLPGDEMVRRLSRGYPEKASDQELKRIRDRFQQGYMQSYSFEYQQARETMSWVLAELTHFPPIPQRWDLYVKANIFLGIAQSGDKQEDQALQSFATVLRCRPGMELSRKEYSPKVIRLWEKAKKRLGALPRGKLAVDSDPGGADVFLDGVRVGSTPYIGDAYFGRYHLHVRHKVAGSASRRVDIGKQAARIHLLLAFEGALDLDGLHPLVRLPGGRSELPADWIPWLGDRLGVRYLVAVLREADGSIHAALLDLPNGSTVRRGSMEQDWGDPIDLARFIVTGQAGDNVKVADVSVKMPETPLVPPLPVLYESRPWYRKWWTYSIASAAVLIGGVTSHLLSGHYDDRSNEVTTVGDQNYFRDLSDTCQGLAIAGYALAGAALITGLVMDLTFEPEEVYISPVMSSGFAGVTFSLRF